MTVKELKEAIADLPDDMEVIIQKDAEGNEYSPLYVTDPGAVYIPDSTYSGEVLFLEWSAEIAGKPEDEWEEIKLKPKALILVPVN